MGPLKHYKYHQMLIDTIDRLILDVFLILTWRSHMIYLGKGIGLNLKKQNIKHIKFSKSFFNVSKLEHFSEKD